jgi:hypothetical protein
VKAPCVAPEPLPGRSTGNELGSVEPPETSGVAWNGPWPGGEAAWVPAWGLGVAWPRGKMAPLAGAPVFPTTLATEARSAAEAPALLFEAGGGRCNGVICP